MRGPRIRCVCVESPLRGDYKRNARYADACMRDCFDRGEAPFLGHLLYPRVLDDTNEIDRARGVAAHCAWLAVATRVAVYADLGMTDGMTTAVELARELQIPVEFRRLGEAWADAAPPAGTPGFQ